MAATTGEHDVGRRGVLVGAATGLLMSACASQRGEMLAETWAPARPRSGELSQVQGELVRLATLAANSHNSQPWRFLLSDDAIMIRPDVGRRLPVVDPDDHHLWASLGCAAQNIVEAARAFGLVAEASFCATPAPGAVRVQLGRAAPCAGPSIDAITQRECRRSVYDGRALASSDLERLAATGRPGDVDLLLLTDPRVRQALTDLIVRGNTAQVGDRAFRAEVKEWLRFNEAQAASTRDGLFVGCVGSSSVPTFLGKAFFDWGYTVDKENEKLKEQLASSSAFAVFLAAEATPKGWVAVGQAAQRFALEATRIGVAYAFVNQPVEVARLRPELASLVGAPGRRPDLLARIGHGPDMPRSLRRAPSDVVDA